MLPSPVLQPWISVYMDPQRAHKAFFLLTTATSRTPRSLLGMFLAVAATAAAVLIYRFWANLASVNYDPGMRPLFAPLGIVGALIPTCWGNPGLKWVWEWRRTNFFSYKYDVVSMVPLLVGEPCYYTCSVDVVRQLLQNETKTRLVKPRWLTAPLFLWGENVISANDEVWKRHRRILAPTFTAKTYSLVVTETTAAYREMFVSEGWENRDEVAVADMNRLAHKLALIIIARCGFGFRTPWTEAPESSAEMSFGESLLVVSSSAITRLVVPKWAYNLPIETIRVVDTAWRTLGAFMHRFVEARRAELNGITGDDAQPGDIFSRLVSCMDQDSKTQLSEEEVIGNTFALLFAGRETTACAIVATLGFLAIHQEHQATAYAEIMASIPAGRDPVLDDLSKLQHLMACYHESIRMYPGGAMLTREMTEDVVIKVARPVETTMVLKKGALMVVEMIAVHHNPHVFPDPNEFRPSRWYGVPEADVPMFGAGPRACIGKKFSHTEALCFLSLLLRDWKIDVPLNLGESRAQYEDRVMGRAGRVGLSFGCGSIALKMSRRK
ncbi:cytochrome P450 [Mycena belliarum]|uniref:Cytochrome P450 n=1 Tax=Mycena belliarum TaxID=1033014 RepID=A0AAD6TQJ3_9AGAR|nr:cytochrome P450 [Mycena belliae]